MHWKSIVPLLLLSVGLPLAGIAQTPPFTAKLSVEGPEKRGSLETYTLASDYLEAPAKLYVLLPDNFDRSRRYPVLYVLPVNKAPSASGIIEARKLGLANQYGVICVGPDFPRIPWYGDCATNPAVRYASYVPEVVVPFIDRTYPTLANAAGRTLIGFSKSGIGALTILLQRPEMFGRAGAWDSPLMLGREQADHFYGSPERFLGYYGTETNFLARFHLPTLWRQRAELLRAQPARIVIGGYDHFAEDTAAADRLLTTMGIPHVCDNQTQRPHDWSSGWMASMVETLFAVDMTQPARK